jgi:hypothetical protein
MQTITKQNVTTITLHTKDAMQWIDDNICIARSQWTKNEDTGELAFMIDSQFENELLDEMLDDLVENVDFSIDRS